MCGQLGTLIMMFSISVICPVFHRYRALHGCGKLKFDMSLARSAQKYAEQLAQLGYMNHSSCDGYGENLAARSSSGVAEMTGKLNPICKWLFGRLSVIK